VFGSDWPVCLLAASYSEVAGAARDLTADLTGAERAAVFGGAAEAVYRLSVAPDRVG
jgi:L-fuconolactonase